MTPRLVTIDHPRFRTVWRDVFTRTLVADCMSHRCAMVDPRHEKLDACCQYGCDVDLFEREAILAHAGDLRALLRPEAKDAPWFETEEWPVSDYPSGAAVRTEVLGGGCVFLAHDRRGCAIHRASLERGWDLNGVKPAVCRLFPLSYDGDAIVISEEYPEYSCAHAGGPTLYRLTRDTLGELFGPELLVALDEAERRVLAEAPVPAADRRPRVPEPGKP
jgi:Fe-S-cluster containining protein